MKPLFYRKPVMGGRTQALMVRCFASEDGDTKIEGVITVITGNHAKSVRADVDKYCAALNKATTDFYEGKL